MKGEEFLKQEAERFNALSKEEQDQELLLQQQHAADWSAWDAARRLPEARGTYHSSQRSLPALVDQERGVAVGANPRLAAYVERHLSHRSFDPYPAWMFASVHHVGHDSGCHVGTDSGCHVSVDCGGT